MSDETQNSSLATQKVKPLWTTPRVVLLLAEGGTAGKVLVGNGETSQVPPPTYNGPS